MPSVTFWAHVVTREPAATEVQAFSEGLQSRALSALHAGARARHRDRKMLRVSRAYPRGHVG